MNNSIKSHYNRLEDIKAKFNKKKSAIKDINELAKELKSAQADREKHYFIMRKEISYRLSILFSMNLSQRGYSGQIKVRTSPEISTLLCLFLSSLSQSMVTPLSLLLTPLSLLLTQVAPLTLLLTQVDHKNSELNMQLNMPNRKTHDVKSLSGGERSFSTVCFICSLWCLMESPFRCLDEFDVFMVNMSHIVLCC